MEMEMTDTTNIEDAKAMRRMGLPLNTPVTHKTFSKQYTELWVRYMKACYAFTNAFLDYHAKPGKRRYERCVSTFMKLADMDVECLSETFVLDDEGERRILGALREQKLRPFIEMFDAGFAALQNGEEFECPPIKSWSIWWEGWDRSN
jgi:hypothetical protein